MTAVAALAVARSMSLSAVVTRLQDTTAEIRVRAAVLLLVGFVALAAKLGLETILGAFLAGAVVGLVDKDTSSHPHFRIKLEALGYGFLIPVFFVSSGLRLDLAGLIDDPSALARVPVLALALLVVRGLPALLLARQHDRRSVAAAGLLQATSLPFLVTASQIGVATGTMSQTTAAALGLRRPALGHRLSRYGAGAAPRRRCRGRGRYAAAVFRCPTSTTPSTILTS